MTRILKPRIVDSMVVVLAGLAAGLLAIIGSQSTLVVPLALLVALGAMAFAYHRPITTVYIAILAIPLETLSTSAGGSFVLLPTKVIALAATAGWVARRFVRGRESLLPFSTPLMFPLLLFLAAHIPGLFLAADSNAVLKDLVIWTAWYILFLAVVADPTESTTRTLAAAIAVSGGVVAAIAVVKTSGSSQVAFEAAGQVTNRAQGSFSSPVALGIFLTVILPLQLVLAFKGWSNTLRMAAGAGAILSVLAIVLALTRGAFLSLAIAVVWLVAAFQPARRPALVILVVLGVFILSGVNPDPSLVNFNVLIQRITSINSQTYTAQLRLELWRVVPHMFWNTFPFGIGPKNFPVQAPYYGLNFAGGEPSNAHNTFLVIASEMGVPGLIALFWLVVAIARSALRCLRSLTGLEHAFALALTGSFLSLVVDGITDYSYNEDSFLLTVVMLFALLARLNRSARSAENSQLRSGMPESGEDSHMLTGPLALPRAHHSSPPQPRRPQRDGASSRLASWPATKP